VHGIDCLINVISVYGLMASDDDEEHLEGGKYSATENSRYYVQYHYLLAWLTVVVGYPSVVVHAWMVHYNNTSAQVKYPMTFHNALCIITIEGVRDNFLHIFSYTFSSWYHP